MTDGKTTFFDEAGKSTWAGKSIWWNRDRIVGWGAILLALEILFLAFMVMWHHDVFGRVDPPASTDFVSFYAAGKLALAGSPELAYDRAVHAAAEIAATQPGAPYQFFFYPPVYLLICAPLAVLPYMTAFLVFQAATFAAWIMVMRAILQPRGWSWCLPVIAYPATFWTLGLGQNAFLTAALVGGVTLLVDKRPIVAGLLLGLLCYKPHLAILIPIALVAGGRWRTLLAASVSTLGVIAVSVAAFGVNSWLSYKTALAGAQMVYEDGSVDLAGFVTPYGAARVLGATSGQAWLLQTIVAVLVVVAISWIWHSGATMATRSAALAAGILLSIPLALVYDLLLLTVAMAWLVRESRDDGFRAGEKSAMFICYLIPLAGLEVGHHFHLPLLPLAPISIMTLILLRAYSSNRLGPAPLSLTEHSI